MPAEVLPSPYRVLFAVGLGTAASLSGDAALYAVLPTHTADAGIVVANVGTLLSANRLIRLLLNGPAGWLCDRWPRRRLFVPALFLGAISTAVYALTDGFWPLLAGRLLWGLSWSGIWVGGNAIMLDLTREHDRGRWMGIYMTCFFLGTASGSLMGGVLTDALGYHAALGVASLATLAGAMLALVVLPETRHRAARDSDPPAVNDAPPARLRRTELVAALALLGVSRLTVAGVLSSTLGRLLLNRFGENISVAGRSVGVATLTGLALGINTLVSMVAAPLVGRWSDRRGRWLVAAGGLAPGAVGFLLLALAMPVTIVTGLPLIAITGGSNPALASALIGDLGGQGRRGRQLGRLFTIGDFASAVGPLLAYALMPHMGISGLYVASAAVLVLMLVVAMGCHRLGRVSTT